MMTSKISEHNDIMKLIHQLNSSIEAFIRGTIESSFNIEELGPLSNVFEAIRCRDIKGCQNKECPAYDDKDYRCWLKVGTLCDGKVQGEFAKKITTCFECEVFKIISKEPLRLLYENINTLIFHVKDKGIKLQALATKDHLTDLYNRHYLNEIIERETARSERYEEPLSLLMVDLDYLKQINDTLGHLMGDRILVEAASVIKHTLRKTDYLFRFGGDEFLIILPETDCAESANMVIRLLHAVDFWNKNNENTFGCKLSFSIGCSTHEKGSDFDQTIKRADTNMYQNKMSKRVK